MTPRDPDKKMLAATSTTVQKYEQALIDLQAGVPPMTVYDRLWDECQFCEAAMDEDGWTDCQVCMLGPEPNGCMNGDMDQSWRARMNVKYWDRRDLTRTVRLRLAAIMRHIKSRGYEVK